MPFNVVNSVEELATYFGQIWSSIKSWCAQKWEEFKEWLLGSFKSLWDTFLGKLGLYGEMNQCIL